ncbi:MAG: hypothetical protein RLZZ292_1250 [Bacteroidota bacterium]|jgi:trigger factor
MPQVVREALGNLNSKLIVSIPESEYQPKYKAELARFKNRAQMKGFRKGKTPDSMIKSMHGASIFYELINKYIQESVEGFLKDDESANRILGQPIMAENSPKLNYSSSPKGDFEFWFEVGYSPEFELSGVTKASTFTRSIQAIDPTWIEGDLNNMRRRGGERINIEEDIQDNDVVTLDATEQGKEGGVTANFSVLVKDLTEEAKAKVLTLKKGDAFEYNVFALEAERDATHVRKYMLNVTDEAVEIGETFDFTIADVLRVQDAEMNQEFFDKNFGEGTVSSEEEARAFLHNEILKYSEQQGDGLLFRDLQMHLIEANPLELPDEFLKRWLQTTNEKNTADLVERDYPRFAQNMRWTLIRDKIIDEYNIHIHESDLIDGYVAQMQGMYGGQMPVDVLKNIAQTFLKDEKYKDNTNKMVEELMFTKVFKKVSELVTVNNNEVSKEEFERMNEEARATVQQERAEVGELEANTVEGLGE